VPVTSASYSVDGWGVGEVWLEGPALVWHELPRPSTGTRARAREAPTRSMGGVEHPPPSRSTLPRKRARISNRSGPEVEQLLNRFRSYFEGEAVTFDDVRLEAHDWTPFQLDCLRALRNVPYGDVVSYSELARLAGHPRAQRAAGTFCAGNRFALVVPCHRVVAADGLGSYPSLGVDYKRRLLALEGVTL
jgi:methylated-DNA-[protein]-cysteine S-methyltransferase